MVKSGTKQLSNVFHRIVHCTHAVQQISLLIHKLMSNRMELHISKMEKIHM